MADVSLSILLVGAGGMGAVWLEALAGPLAEALGVRLVGVCDVDRDRAAAARAMAPDVAIWSDLDAALAMPPDIVVDCTTPNAREAVVAKALARGVHVLCEKPLAPDEAAATRLIGAAGRARGRLAVSQNRRFQPGLRQMRAAVAAGDLGAPQTLSARLHMAPRFGGFREAMAHVMLRDMAIHAFDAARAILRQDAVSVICVERTPAGQPFADGPEVHALFEMSRGALFAFAGDWTDAGPPSSWNGAWRMTLSGGAIRWDGEGAAAAWRTPAAGAAGLVPDPVPVALAAAPDGLTDIAGSLAAFVAAIRTGGAAETDVRDNARSLAMVFAAIRSARADGRREGVRDLALSGDASGLRAPRPTGSR